MITIKSENEHISPVYALFVLRELRRQPCTEAQLFQHTNLSRQKLEAGTNIPMVDFVQFLLNAQHSTNNNELGLLIGKQANILVLGDVGLAAIAAPTVREGFQALETFTRLHANYIQLELQSNLESMIVNIHFLNNLSKTERFHAESAVMVFQHYIELIVGQPFTDGHYNMTFQEPSYSEKYLELMHSPMHFNHKVTSIEIPRSYLDQRSPYFNRDLWEKTQKGLSEKVRQLGTRHNKSYTEYVFSQMLSCNPPLPNLDAIANKLHVSERTLNRRLQKEHTNFRGIKTQVMHDWAKRHLANTQLSVDSIALSLGYQDTANFRRAFKKLEGCSPSAFRQQQNKAD